MCSSDLSLSPFAHQPLAMAVYRITLLCASLLGASAWMLAVPGSRARHTSAAGSRLPVAPQMTNDGLSAEFQRLVSQRSGTVFGHPSEVLREQRAERSWVLIFNAGEADEGVCAQPVTTSACDRTYPSLWRPSL